MRVREPGGQLLARALRAANWLYLLHLKMAQPVCLVMRGRDDKVAWRWHERFGHINMAALRKLAREELVRGLLELGQVERVCEACQAGKQRRTSFPAQSRVPCALAPGTGARGPLRSHHAGDAKGQQVLLAAGG